MENKKKIIYGVLSVATLALLLYTGYYTYSHKTTSLPAMVVATSTPQVATTTTPDLGTKSFTTQTGKTITVAETNPSSESLSTLTITTTGFATDTPIILEKNKLTDSFLIDLNKDTFDELVLITTAQGSGSYGEVSLFTTTKDEKLTPVMVPELTESDTKKGALFEGYMGHDTFAVVDGVLVREFPTFTASDTNSMPTGPKKAVAYTFTEKNGTSTVTYIKHDPLTLVSSSTPGASSSTTTPTSLPPVTATSTPPLTIASSTALPPLSGTVWTWSSALASGTTLTPAKPEKFIITFEKGTKVTSTTDCNSINGEYAATKEALKFSAFISTLMFCDGSQEGVYSELLSKTKAYTIDTDTLTLTLEGKDTLTFKRKK